MAFDRIVLCGLFLLLVVGIRSCFSQADDYNCYDFQFNPRVCLPGPENLIKRRQLVVTPNSTCGNPASGFCPPQPRNKCFMCDSNNSTLSHPADAMTDSDIRSSFWRFGHVPSWWQSLTWWDALTRGSLVDRVLKVNISLALHKKYDLFGEVKVTFYSARPNAMVILKSADFGATYTPYRYYADNCARRFGASIPTRKTTPLSVYCEQHGATSAIKGSEVKFEPQFQVSDFWRDEIQRYTEMTNLLIRLEYPWTDGNEFIEQENYLNQYYYDITDIQVYGRCHCNGHAPFCVGSAPNLTCACLHNTTGVDCQMCQPLYNNKPWKPAESDSQPNPCEECICNEHSLSCTFNATLNFGICDECLHNTIGLHCEECQDNYYWNNSVPFVQPKACIDCDCFVPGTTNSSKCTKNSTDPLEIGQCPCRSNIEGRRCDACKNGFYGITLNPFGICKGCLCNHFGTVNQSLSCHQTTGQCQCKTTTTGQLCDVCKPGFYHYPNSSNGQCLPCDCSIGGTTDQMCDTITGRCLCLPNVNGSRCDRVNSGHFFPAFVHPVLEAEDQIGNYVITSSTSARYAQLRSTQDHVAFSHRSDISLTANIIIGYHATNATAIKLSMLSSKSSLEPKLPIPEATLNLLSNETVYTLSSPVYMVANSQYVFNITLITELNPIADFKLDRISFAPIVTTTKIYERGNITVRTQLDSCRRLASFGQIDDEACRSYAFETQIDIYEGALACSCDGKGSFNVSQCQTFGGHCSCKDNVTGRMCNHCSVASWGLSSSGCKGCGCSSLNSLNPSCDVITGQCPCKTNVTGLTCGQCVIDHYGLASGVGCQPCNCDVLGSRGSQCHDNGTCTCLASTIGEKCDQCMDNYYNFTSNGCSSCNCNATGSTSLQCDPERGNCSCKLNVAGWQCSACAFGAFDYNNGNGCTSCHCSNQSTICTSATGYVRSVITSPFNNVSAGWTIYGNFSLQNNGIAIKSSATTPARYEMTAPQEFLGHKLSSYSSSIYVTVSTFTADSNAARVNLTVTWTNSFNQSQELHSSLNGARDTAVLDIPLASSGLVQSRMLSILASLRTMKFTFDVTANVSLVVHSIAMGTSVQGDAGVVSMSVEKCTCPANYSGFSCQTCAQGFTRENTAMGINSACVACSCNGRADSCNGETGECIDCRHGTTGFHCEKCQPGVKKPQCIRCQQDHYGFNDTSFVGCQSCDCYLPNTVNMSTSSCDLTSGQCHCRDDIGGKQCHRCVENAVNTSLGCQRCSSCHGLLANDLHFLRIEIRRLASTLNFTTSNTSTQPLSFSDMVKSAAQRVNDLASSAAVSATAETTLLQELTSVNATLNHLEAVLVDTVAGLMRSRDVNLDVSLTNSNTTMNLMEEIRRVLTMAVAVGYEDLVNQTNSTRSLLQRLESSESRYSALASRLNASLSAARREAVLAVHDVRIALQLNTNLTDRSSRLQAQQNETSQRLMLLNRQMGDIAGDMSTLRDQSEMLRDNATALKNTSVVTLKNGNTSPARGDVNILQSRYDNLSMIFINLNSSIDNLHSKFLRQALIAQQLRVEVVNVSGRVIALETEARRLIQLAANSTTRTGEAIQSVSRDYKAANETLDLLLDYNRTVNDAIAKATQALEIVDQVNETSAMVIDRSNRIKNELRSTQELQNTTSEVAAAADGITKNTHAALQSLETNAVILKLNYTARQNLAEIASSIATTWQAVYYKAQEDAMTCAVLSTNLTSVIHGVNTASKRVNATFDASVTTRQSLQRLIDKLSTTPQVNASLVEEIQTNLTLFRQNFITLNIKPVMASLQTSFTRQQKQISDYRVKIKDTKTEVDDLKTLYNSLALDNGCR